MDTKDIAAFNLVGQTLNATWVVKQRIDKEPSGTGGFFSVCYLVEDRLHNNFFLKAFNINAFKTLSKGKSWMDYMKEMTDAYLYEKKLSEYCQQHHVTKVSFVIDSGEIELGGYTFPIVPYLVFEMADGDVRRVLNNSVSNYAILSIEKDGFITVEKLLPSQENSQYQYDKILSITPPFENIQLISNIIGLLIKKELSNNYQQYLNDNIFIISEVIISPFKILKCIEFNVEIFPTGDYLIHFLPVTKIIGDQSPITESYLSKLRTHFHTQNNNSKDIKCTLINKRNLYKVKLDILSNEAFSEIKPYINNNIIQLATFDYHFLAAYSEAIFQKIISETCKKLTDTIWFVDGVISNLSLTTLSGLSPDTYLNVDIVKLGEKPNLYVGCQYNETLTFHSISNTQYGLRVEYTRDNESQDVLICNFIKDQHLTNKLAKLNFPITVQGKTRYHKETNRFFLIDIFVDGNINAAKAIQQYAVYHTGIYKPVDNWSILPILYGINDISLFRELILAFNKKNIDILTPYIIQNNEIDTLELNRRIPQKKKVFMPVICKNQMPTNIISSIKSLKRKYQIFLGNTDDNKDNRARLSNYICKCLQKMGGIISLIADTTLPVSGYFIGLDLGHTTHGNKKYSNIGVSLFNCHGLLVGNHVLKDLPRNEKLDYPQCKAVISELNKIILPKKRRHCMSGVRFFGLFHRKRCFRPHRPT